MQDMMDEELFSEETALTGSDFAEIEEMMKSGDLSVEDAFARLEQIIRRMEDEKVTLEESFACYEMGVRLVRYCNARIDRVEKKIQMLRGEGEAPLEGDDGTGSMN